MSNTADTFKSRDRGQWLTGRSIRRFAKASVVLDMVSANVSTSRQAHLRMPHGPQLHRRIPGFVGNTMRPWHGGVRGPREAMVNTALAGSPRHHPAVEAAGSGPRPAHALRLAFPTP